MLKNGGRLLRRALTIQQQQFVGGNGVVFPPQNVTTAAEGGLSKRNISSPTLTCLQQSDSSAASPSTSSSDGDGGLTLTDSCVSRLKEVAKNNEKLRVTVDGGGCSGFEYKFNLDAPDTPINAADDLLFTRDGVTVVVDRLTLDYIRGAKVDYVAELIKSSFRIVDNPLAEKGCSCGASFSLKV